MKETVQLIADPSEAERLMEIHKIGCEIPVAAESLPEPKLSENAKYISDTRYSRRDADGNAVETPKDLMWRVAYNIATADRLYGADKKQHIRTATKFYKLMATRRFLPNTPTLLNTGKMNQQLSACFVLPVEDSLDGILQSAADMAKIHKSGGGTGFSFSRLRPKNDTLSTSGGTTTGPISFMQMYNDITSSVRQGGVRRGANMGILHYNHPDILLFAIYKLDEFSLTNFNISVTTAKEFFEQIEIDKQLLDEDYEKEFDFDALVDDVREAHQTRDMDLKQVRLDNAVARLRDWCDEPTPGYGYALINPRNGEETGRLNAKKVFDVITRFAWQYGDPGMIFIDRINESRANPTPLLGQIEATNPCGEQPLLPYDACTLGSINLAQFVDGKDFDWEGLRKTTHQSIHFLDNVLDMNDYPIDKVRDMVHKIRRIGLGIMGFADALLAMNIGYNTAEGVKVAEDVMKFIQAEADVASAELAETRGTFPAFKGSIYDKPGEIHPRNGARTTIAPTGTIAMLADASSGCEPLFALTYVKNTIEGKRMFQTSPYFVAALKKRGLYSEELLEQIQANKGSIQNIESIPDDLKKVFVTAGDISPQWHLKIQAAFQKYVDNAISKTINFSNDATVEDVREAYLTAHETGCRGITIYRDGSRDKQVLETKKESSYYDKLAETNVSDDEEVEIEIVSIPSGPIRLKPRPNVLNGRTHKVMTPLGKAFISINEDQNGDIFEVFINVGRAGSDVTADAEAIGRLISLTFRIPSEYSSNQVAQKVITQLRGIGGSSSTGFGADRVRSLADAVAKVIEQHQATKVAQEPIHIEQAENATLWIAPKSNSAADMCPECGSASLRFIEGCQKCELCGFSKC
ncbi:ribonucleoside-diphosphate reductase, adenosylcobalamin-dependent [Candidatus Saccharibacteria bacterium HGW-Saccharibacteria-1]|jgi:ribonucleoside-diphosphate reductase alpha chain|nr:MAG: ribonucleoside-diphosphate reductase, adenosylcobalamin-dependent [Candidatus Saccharibacteria bacterium HGW-Saccharibacteria-1]